MHFEVHTGYKDINYSTEYYAYTLMSLQINGNRQKEITIEKYL